MKRYSSTFLIGFLSLLAACSGSATSSTSGSSSISSIGDLPRASSAVADATNANLSFLRTKSLVASSGLTLSESSTESFSSESSMAMCLTTNSLKQSLKSSSFADMVMCYLQSSLEDQAGSEIYDGNSHTFNMTFLNDPFEDEGGTNMVIKLQIAKTNNVISDFKMWSCESGVQTDYVNYQNGSDLTITSKSAWDDENGSGAQTTSVSGEVDLVNGSVAFTSKLVESQYSSTWGYSNGYGESSLTQGADSATITSVDVGTFSDGSEETGTYTNRFVSLAELLDDDSLATIAMGSGAAIYEASGTFSGGSYSDSGSEAWDGDTTLIEESNIYLSDVEAESLPTAPSEAPSIGFSGSEVFDCDDTGAQELVLDFDSPSVTECNDIQSIDNEYIDCYGVIQNGGES